MDRKKKKKKIKKAKALSFMLVVIVLVYFSLRSIPILIASKAKTITVETGEIIDYLDCEGIILRDETVYNSQADGNIEFQVENGSRIGVAIKVAEIRNRTFNNYKKELEEVDREIEEYKKRLSSQNEVLKQDLKKSQDEIDYIMVKLQTNIAEQNYEEVKRLKDRLLIVTNKRDAITSERRLVTDQIDNLMKKRSEIVSKMKNSNYLYYSQYSGMFSSSIDGLEEKFSSKEIDKYRVDDFNLLKQNNIKVQNEDSVKVGQPIFKIIKGQYWYIMTRVKISEIEKVEEGNTILVNLGEVDREIKGVVSKVEKSKEEMLIILRFRDYLHEFYDQRYIDFKIINNNYKGLKVPKNSIIEKDKIKGVYIKDISGIVRFREVKVLYGNDEYVIVESEESRQALKMFDEVFLNPRRVKEGQIIN